MGQLIWISAIEASNEAAAEIERLGLGRIKNEFKSGKGRTKHGTHVGGRGKSSGRGMGGNGSKK